MQAGLFPSPIFGLVNKYKTEVNTAIPMINELFDTHIRIDIQNYW